MNGVLLVFRDFGWVFGPLLSAIERHDMWLSLQEISASCALRLLGALRLEGGRNRKKNRRGQGHAIAEAPLWRFVY